MSLLWKSAAWWTSDPDELGEYEEGLRDPKESGKARGQRYVSQVVDRHGVPRAQAEKAVRRVIGHHERDQWANPTDYGFASSGNQMSHYSPGMESKLMNPETWRGRKVQQVSLHQPIHATQSFLRPESIAHNLFHPHRRQAELHEAVGDPDYDPDWDKESRDETDSFLDSEGSSDPEQRELHKNVYFMRRNNGHLEVVDGHHRVATDMLLGKSHTPGIVIHERELEHGNAPTPVHDVEQHLKDHHQQNWLDPSWDPHEFHRELHEDSSLEEHDAIPHRHAHYQRT